MITLRDGAFPTRAGRRVTAPPDLLTALFANVKGVRHIKREFMKKSPMLMQGAGGAIGVVGVSFQLAGERDLYSERRLDFLSGCLFSLLGGVGFLRVGYKEKKVSI